MSTDQDLNISNMINLQAAKQGLSSKEAKRAYKKIKAGGIMAQVAPQLHSQFMEMNPTLTPKDKLRNKVKNLKQARLCKYSKDIAYEKARQDLHEKQEKEQAEKEEKKLKQANKKRNLQKKLKEIEKRLGMISQEKYNECLLNISENKYKDESSKNHDRNIIELYNRQQNFKDQISMDDLDEI